MPRHTIARGREQGRGFIDVDLIFTFGGRVEAGIRNEGETEVLARKGSLN